MIGIIIRRVVYPLNEWREGTRVLASLRSLMATQYESPDRLLDLRWRKLQKLLQHAYQRVPFYRERFREAGIAPGDIRTFDDLRRLRPVTKDDIANNLDRFTATNIPRWAMHRGASGGSTGRHTPFYRDNACLNMKRAAELRFNSWCGWNVGEKVAYFWPAIQDLVQSESWRTRLRRNLLDRALMLNAGNLNEAVLASYATALRRFAPVLIRAFPNPLSILAKYVRGVRGHGVRPAAILTTGEPLLPTQRAAFEEVFGCRVFDCYASRECGQHACECEAHEGLHINAECLYLEFEWDGRPVQSGQPGRILVTDFENLGMPFIRYQIEDIGIPLDGTCTCGRTLPRMSMEAGRVSDFIVSPYDRSLVSGAALCHYFLAAGPDVGQIQVIQDARDHLTILVRNGGGKGSRELDVAHVQQVIARVFHGAMRVTFERRESIPHEKSGKYRFCISEYIKSPRNGRDMPAPAGRLEGASGTP